MDSPRRRAANIFIPLRLHLAVAVQSAPSHVALPLTEGRHSVPLSVHCIPTTPAASIYYLFLYFCHPQLSSGLVDKPASGRADVVTVCSRMECSACSMAHVVNRAHWSPYTEEMEKQSGREMDHLSCEEKKENKKTPQKAYKQTQSY